jgi:hypothetical protein
VPLSRLCREGSAGSGMRTLAAFIRRRTLMRGHASKARYCMRVDQRLYLLIVYLCSSYRPKPLPELLYVSLPVLFSTDQTCDVMSLCLAHLASGCISSSVCPLLFCCSIINYRHVHHLSCILFVSFHFCSYLPVAS